MFTLLNVYTTEPLKIRVQYREKMMDLDISSLVFKRNKAELDENNQMVLLNAYLDYKGDDFKNHLFEKLQIVSEVIINNVAAAELPDITPNTLDILNMFDLQDIYNFVTTVYKLPRLSIFKDSFDKQLELDDILTREQTYIQQDYFELVSLVIPLKVIVGVLGTYTYVFNKRMPANKELLLYKFIKKYVEQSPAVTKLKGYIERIAEQQASASDDKVRVIENFIPEEETAIYVLASLLITKLSMAVVITDTNEKNIVHRVYNFVINKRKIKQDSATRINDRVTLTDADTGEKESILESYRVISKLAAATTVEFDWAVRDIYKLAQQLDPAISKTFLDSTSVMKHKLEKLINNDYKIIIELLGIIFKNIIDPRMIEYLSLDKLINLIRVAYCYLWVNDNKFLALLVVSVTNSSDNYDELVMANTSVARTRLSKDMMEELNKIFPYERVINPTKTENVASKWITDYIVKLESKQWIPLADKDSIVEVYGNMITVMMLPKDIKNVLAKFLIDNEKRIYKK